MSHRILTQELAQLLFLVVALSMALTPFLAELGQKVGKAFDSHDMKARLSNLPVPVLCLRCTTAAPKPLGTAWRKYGCTSKADLRCCAR